MHTFWIVNSSPLGSLSHSVITKSRSENRITGQLLIYDCIQLMRFDHWGHYYWHAFKKTMNITIQPSSYLDPLLILVNLNKPLFINTQYNKDLWNYLKWCSFCFLPPHGQSKAPKIGSNELLQSGLTQSAITFPHNNCCLVPQ